MWSFLVRKMVITTKTFARIVARVMTDRRIDSEIFSPKSVLSSQDSGVSVTFIDLFAELWRENCAEWLY